MRAKYQIELRTKEGVKVGEISRKIWAEQIGNFNPIFCRYNGSRYLVQSKEGDISDPFRRDVTYLETLYITI